MEAIKKLDEIVTEIAKTLFISSPIQDWKQQKLVAKYTPDGSVAAHDYDYLKDNGTVDLGTMPDLEYHLRIGELTLDHWALTQKLGQPRWYKMIMQVERDGKFNMELEYRENYKEGDIKDRA